MHFFSLDVLYAPRLPDLYFWWKSCVLYSRFYGKQSLVTLCIKTDLFFNDNHLTENKLLQNLI